MINKSQEEIVKKWQATSLCPLVSIRCLAYNHAKFIKKTIDGFLMQETDFPFEVIIHDDASTDETANIIRLYEQKYPLIIKPIYEKENQYSKKDGSLHRIMNSACKGQYIAYCEGDDCWIAKDKLQRQIDILRNNPQVSMVHTGYETIDENGNLITRPFYQSYQKISTKENGLVSLFKTNHIMTLSIVIRKEVLFTNLYKNTPYTYDYALFLSAAFVGQIKFIPEKMGAYRRNLSSLTQSKASSVKKQLKDVYMYFANHYIVNKQDLSFFSHIQVLFWIMHHMLIWKKYSIIIKIQKKHHIAFLLLPLCIAYTFASSIKNKCFSLLKR